MSRPKLKVCQKRDGKAQWIDKIFVCAYCGNTIAGGPGIHTYDVWGKDVYCCKKCAFQKFHLDIDGGKVLNDYLKEGKMKYKPYSKVVDLPYALCAIYEPHPFRSCAISEAVGYRVDTGVDDSKWSWVLYDFCGNPIGVSDEKPNGKDVDSFTVENLGGFSWTTP